jgi:hypothetical protein
MKMPKVFDEVNKILLSLIIINIYHQSVLFIIKLEVSGVVSDYEKLGDGYSNEMLRFLIRRYRNI